MSFFTAISQKNEEKINSQLKNTLGQIISLIENNQGSFGLEKKLDFIGEELAKINFSTILTVYDSGKKCLSIKSAHLVEEGAETAFLPKEKLTYRKLPLAEHSEYELAFTRKEAVFCPNRMEKLLQSYPEFDGKYRCDKKQFSIISPMILRNEVIGAVEACSANARKDHVALFNDFAKNLAFIIADDILFDELKISEARYRNLFENAQEGFIIYNSEAKKFTEANKGAYDITGYTSEELKQINYLNLFAPESRNEAGEYIKEAVSANSTADARKNEFKNLEIGIIAKKKEPKCISLAVNPTVKNTEWFFVINDITKNKKFQQKLEWSKNHYEHVIDAIRIGICVIDENFKVISANKFFADKVKLPINKLRGRNFDFLMARYDRERIKNFGCAVCQGKCVVKSSFCDGKTKEEMCQTVDKRGRPRFHSVRVFPSRNSEGKIFQTVVIIRDVTDAVMREKEIQALSEFNQKILDNTPVSILALDRKGRIISVNKKGQWFMGKTNKETAGKKLTDSENMKNFPALKKLYKNLLTKGKPFHFENYLYQTEKKDRQYYLNILAVPLLNQNRKIEGAVSMAIDNTESVLAKQKLEALNNELEKKIIERTAQIDRSNKELHKALELKTRFISDASHELRTPLTVIKGNLDLILRGMKNEKDEALEILKLINKEVDHITNILTDLTLLTSGDAFWNSINYGRVNLSALIKAVSNSLDVFAKEKRIKIIVKKIPNNLEIMGDEEKLEKLLLNFLRNAIKYGKNRGWVKISAKKHGDTIDVKIEDNGIGIAEKDLPYIFERFYRSDHARASSESGSGLGLAISKWIAEAHRGSISAESKLGKGSLFTVHLFTDFKRPDKTSSLF